MKKKFFFNGKLIGVPSGNQNYYNNFNIKKENTIKKKTKFIEINLKKIYRN